MRVVLSSLLFSIVRSGSLAQPQGGNNGPQGFDNGPGGNSDMTEPNGFMDTNTNNNTLESMGSSPTQQDMSTPTQENTGTSTQDMSTPTKDNTNGTPAQHKVAAESAYAYALAFNHTTFADAFEAAGLKDAMSGAGSEFTVLVPSEEAFADSGINWTMWLLDDEWSEHVATVMEYHVLLGQDETGMWQKMDQVETLLGDNITVTRVQPQVVFDQAATVVNADVVVGNGMVDEIDTVLLPGDIRRDLLAAASARQDLSSFVDVLVSSPNPLERSSGPWTLFAPTNDAMANFDGTNGDWAEILQMLLVPAVVLKADLVAGGSIGNLTVSKDVNGTLVLQGEARVVESDILSRNGVLHIIDAVVTPDSTAEMSLTTNNNQPTNNQTQSQPMHNDNQSLQDPTGGATQASNGENATVASEATTTATTDATPSAGSNIDITVIDVVKSNQAFATFLNLMDRTTVEGTLEGAGPYTVFVPVNNAFKSLPQGYLESLTAKQLQMMLACHVVPGVVMANDLTDGTTLTDMEGGEIVINTKSDVTMINNAKLLDSNLVADNGVVHVIKGVLIPPEMA